MIFRHIGRAARDQPLDDGAHLGDMLGRAGLDGRLEAAERFRIGLELRLGRRRDPRDRLVQGQVGIIARSTGVDLVIDVGDVARIGDVFGPVEMAQQAKQHVRTR